MTFSLVADSGDVIEQALTFPDKARALSIVDAATYAAACEFLKGIKALRAEIADTFSPHITRAHEAHKALLKERADAEAPLAEAERIAKAALVVYDQAQERERQAEMARLREDARRQEADRRLTEAVALEAEGSTAEAEALMEMPIDLPVIAVAPSIPKVTGISYRETWSGTLTDLAALIRYVAANPQFMSLLQVNQVALNGLARSIKGQLQIPGVQAVSTRDVAARR